MTSTGLKRYHIFGQLLTYMMVDLFYVTRSIHNDPVVLRYYLQNKERNYQNFKKTHSNKHQIQKKASGKYGEQKEVNKRHEQETA